RSHVCPAGTDAAGRSSNVRAIFRELPRGFRSSPRARPITAKERQTHGTIEIFIVLPLAFFIARHSLDFESKIFANGRRRAWQRVHLGAALLMLDRLVDNRIQGSSGNPSRQAADKANTRNA